MIFVPRTIVALILCVLDFSTSRVMASISGMLPADVRVVRGGSAVTVPASGLVTGDLVDIVLGQKIPADLRLVHVGGDLRFDRSILTGESDPIAGTVNSTSDNFLESKPFFFPFYFSSNTMLSLVVSQECCSGWNPLRVWKWTRSCDSDR
jgi:P-type E1-E2 ATPase